MAGISHEPAMRRTAALMAQITNMSGRSLKNNKTVSPDDFMGGKRMSQTPEEQIAFFKSLSNESK